MATAVGIASQQGTSGVTINTSGIKGAGRSGILVLSWNAPGHNSGIIGSPTIPAGWTQLAKGDGTANFRPGVGAWWGPLETVDSVVVGSSPATVHMSGSVVAFDTMGTPTATARTEGYSTGPSNTFPNVAGDGGWVALCGINTDTRTGTFNLTHAQTYESTQYSGATVFAGTVGPSGFTSQAGTFTLSGLDNWAMMLVSFEDGTPPVTYNWTDIADVIIDGNLVGSGVGNDLNSTDVNGVDNTAGQPVTYDERWDVTPSVPPSVLWPFRVTLPAGYPTSDGYRVYARLVDAAGTALGPEVECVQDGTGLTGIIGGETAATFSPTLETF